MKWMKRGERPNASGEWLWASPGCNPVVATIYEAEDDQTFRALGYTDLAETTWDDVCWFGPIPLPESDDAD